MSNMNTDNQAKPPSWSESSEPTLMEILSYYSQDGFTGDAYATEDGMIRCDTCSSLVTPEHVDVHSIRRLEGQSDPSDSLGVIALVCPVCGAKATMVLKYGADASVGEIAIWQETNDARSSELLPPNSAPGEDDPEIQPDVPDGPDGTIGSADPAAEG